MFHQDSFLSYNNNEINNNEILLGNIEYEISSNGKVINIHVPEEMRKGYVNILLLIFSLVKN